VNEVINIEQKFSLFSDYLSPKRIEMLNGQQIILAKLKGDVTADITVEEYEEI